MDKYAVWVKAKLQEEDSNGWSFDYDFVYQLTKSVRESYVGEEVSMEEVEAVLIALYKQESESPVDRGVEKAAEERSEFLNCVSKTRDKFVITIDRQDWNTEMRTAAEDLLIIYDQMKEVIAGVKDADADKFEFAEWAYDSFCKSNENNWFKPGLAGGTVYYTTEQLYNLFKQKQL